MTIEEAIRHLLYKEHLEDWIYDVRDRASEDRQEGEEDINRWELPRVKKFAEVCKYLKSIFPEHG